MAETTDDATRALLTEEARQINDYVRALGLALVTWFAMNGTINTVAISWFADGVGSGKQRSLASVLLIGIFFVGQSLLAIFALRSLRDYFDACADRLAEIVALQEPEVAALGSGGAGAAPEGPVESRRGTIVAPQAAPRLYAHVVRALVLTMISFVVIWTGLTALGVSRSLAVP
ncbi:MAG: hypothetical protein ACKOCT_13140 [Alphaproteobacteria bacterium]